MKKKVLIEARVNCDPPNHIFRWNRTVEDQAKAIERWIKEFDEFIRDHRSQDPVNLSVERIYQDQCSHCGCEWEETEEGCPVCCDEAINEWNSQLHAKLLMDASKEQS